MISGFINDLRFGLRMALRNPLTSLVVIVSLAIGLGANATIFSFVNAILLRPLPVKEPSRLLEISRHRLKARNAFMTYTTLSFPDFEYYRDHNSVFQDVAGFVPEAQAVSWMQNGQVREVRANAVTSNFFSVTGVRPKAGYFFRHAPAEAGVVLSYLMWQRLGADPGIAGTTLTLNGHNFIVDGVAPRGLSDVIAALRTDVWISMRDAKSIGINFDQTDRHISAIVALGRLKNGVSPATAGANVQLLGSQLASAFPETNKDTTGAVFPAALLPGPVVRGVVTGFMALLMLAMMLVLLVGCANAAHVMLAHMWRRTRELAVRSALGANRGRLLRQALSESIVLALASGVAAVAAATFAAPLLLKLVPSTLPLDLDVSPDGRVFGFVLLFSLLTGLCCGIIPAFRATKIDAAEAIKGGGRTSTPVRSKLTGILVISQVAVCVMLLVGGALCWRSMQAARTLRPGLNPDHVFVSTVELGRTGYSAERTNQFYRASIQKLQHIPGVESVSMIDLLPLGQMEMSLMVQVPGFRPPDGTEGWPVSAAIAAPDYFSTMQTQVLAGREFGERETANAAPVIVINRAMADMFWKHQNAIGKHVTVKDTGTTRSAEIIGVVETGKYRSIGEERTPFFWMPFAQRFSDRAVFVVRTAVDPVAFARTFRKVIDEIDPTLVTVENGSMRQALEMATFAAQATGVLLGIAGILAVVLALSGIYGVVAYMVAQRTHEIGIRMALGAGSREMLAMVLRNSLRLTCAGVLIGVAVAFAGSRLLASVLYGVSATDSFTFIAVAVALILLAAAATYIPARRVMRLDPIRSLHWD